MPNEVHTTSVCRCRSGWWVCPTRASGWVPLGRVCMSHPSEWADALRAECNVPSARSVMYPLLGVRWYPCSGCNVPSVRGAVVHPARGAVVHPARSAMYPPLGVRWYTSLGVQWYTWLGVQCTLRSWLGSTPRSGCSGTPGSDQRYCLARGRDTVPPGAGVLPRSVQR